MPIAFSVDADHRVRTAVFRDRVTDTELVDAYRALLASGYDPALDDLVDLTLVTDLDVSGAAVRRLADLFEDGPAAPPTRLAIVAPRDHHFGLARMYQSLRAEAPEETRIFRARADALAWLGLPPD